MYKSLIANWLLTILITSSSYLVLSQNSHFIFAPAYIKKQTGVIVNLPAPAQQPGGGQDPYYPNNGYDGRRAITAQNIQMNQDDKILFFIIDDHVFDRHGNYLNTFRKYFDSETGERIRGTDEIAIVPVPETCDEYFILTTTNTEIDGMYSPRKPRNTLCHGRIKIKYDEYGNLVAGSNMIALDPQNDYDAYYNMRAEKIDFNNPNNDQAQVYTVDIKLAVTSEENNKRLVFFKGFKALYAMEMTNIGLGAPFQIYQVQQEFGSEYLFGEHFQRGEMEVIKKPGTDHVYYLATPLYNTNAFPGSIPRQSGVVVMEYDAAAGQVIQGSEQYGFVEYPTGASIDKVIVKGVEFSKNAKNVYFTVSTESENSFSGLYGMDLSYGTKFQSGTRINTGSPIFSNTQIEVLDNDRLALIAESKVLYEMRDAGQPIGSQTFFSVLDLGNFYDANYWGVSSAGKLKSFVLQDQLDQDDYYARYSNDLCCIDFSTYETDGYIFNANQDWNPNSCPIDLNNDGLLEVRNEFRIPAGRILRLSGGMQMAFAPNAKLVIEEGAKLILDNATLTIDERCVEGELWKGVEVHGIKTAPQGVLNGSYSANNSLQGHLFMTNGSKIEHAEVAVLLGARNSNDIIAPALKTGGVFQAMNSTLENNKIGVQANPYTLEKSHSWMRYSTLRWTDDNHFINLPLYSGTYLAWLNGHDGFLFGACHFENATTNSNQKGNGVAVIGTNSTFSVVG